MASTSTVDTAASAYTVAPGCSSRSATATSRTWGSPASTRTAGSHAPRTWSCGGSRSRPGPIVSGTYRGTSMSRLMHSAWIPSSGALGSPNPVIPWAVCATAFTSPTIGQQHRDEPDRPAAARRAALAVEAHEQQDGPVEAEHHRHRGE